VCDEGEVGELVTSSGWFYIFILFLFKGFFSFQAKDFEAKKELETTTTTTTTTTTRMAESFSATTTTTATTMRTKNLTTTTTVATTTQQQLVVEAENVTEQLEERLMVEAENVTEQLEEVENATAQKTTTRQPKVKVCSFREERDIIDELIAKWRKHEKVDPKIERFFRKIFDFHNDYSFIDDEEDWPKEPSFVRSNKIPSALFIGGLVGSSLLVLGLVSLVLFLNRRSLHCREDVEQENGIEMDDNTIYQQRFPSDVQIPPPPSRDAPTLPYPLNEVATIDELVALIVRHAEEHPSARPSTTSESSSESEQPEEKSEKEEKQEHNGDNNGDVSHNDDIQEHNGDNNGDNNGDVSHNDDINDESIEVEKKKEKEQQEEDQEEKEKKKEEQEEQQEGKEKKKEEQEEKEEEEETKPFLLPKTPFLKRLYKK